MHTRHAPAPQPSLHSIAADQPPLASHTRTALPAHSAAPGVQSAQLLAMQPWLQLAGAAQRPSAPHVDCERSLAQRVWPRWHSPQVPVSEQTPFVPQGVPGCAGASTQRPPLQAATRHSPRAAQSNALWHCAPGICASSPEGPLASSTTVASRVGVGVGAMLASGGAVTLSTCAPRSGSVSSVQRANPSDSSERDNHVTHGKRAVRAGRCGLVQRRAASDWRRAISTCLTWHALRLGATAQCFERYERAAGARQACNSAPAKA